MEAPLATPLIPGRPCSIAAALEIVGDRWSLLIVREVNFGNHRFSEIARNTSAPRDRLAARLRQLVADEVLERREYQAAPIRSGYHLTRAGRDLVPVLQALLQWGNKWAVAEPAMTVRHRDHELHTGRVCDVCGEALARKDISAHFTLAGWDPAGPVE
jgi:DNA-binding HxlR family transcriptional regulator